MSTTLPTGMKLEKPVTGDKGSVWFPVLERNIDKINDHTHDGTNAAKVLTTDVTSAKKSILQTNWVVDIVGRRWVQELELPNSASYSEVAIIVKDSAGNQLFLDIAPGTTAPNADKKFKVYTNDASISATAHIVV